MARYLRRSVLRMYGVMHLFLGSWWGCFLVRHAVSEQRGSHLEHDRRSP